MAKTPSKLKKTQPRPKIGPTPAVRLGSTKGVIGKPQR